MPAPGGLGAPEALLITGLTSIGVGHTEALIATLSYRLLTDWLPPIPWIVIPAEIHHRGRF